MSTDDFAERLYSLVKRRIGAPGTIQNVRRLTGGANRTTWAFDCEIGTKLEPFILQIGGETEDPVAGVTPKVDSERQAALMIAAVEAGAPAPRVRATLEPEDGLGRGYVTERVDGETLGPRILRDERYAAARGVMAGQCGEILAAIHGIESSKAQYLMRQNAAEHLEAHYKIIDHFGFHSPALEYALRWIAENLPKVERETVVHGDFRLGNLIVGEEGIRCVLDWELAQRGDPMQDLGWLCIRTWRFGGSKPVGGFGSREDLFGAYERASGHSIDPLHVRFWEAFGNIKWAVDCLRLGMRGIEEMAIERSAIGRRIEEPLWDFMTLIDGRD
jgi:aminoglycoside phosphotransferase (APT) family kinase protein